MTHINKLLPSNPQGLLAAILILLSFLFSLLLSIAYAHYPTELAPKECLPWIEDVPTTREAIGPVTYAAVAIAVIAIIAAALLATRRPSR